MASDSLPDLGAPSDDPTSGPNSNIDDIDSSLPSVRARITAFACIIASGLLGAMTGYFFMRTQCVGACTVPNGLGMIAGTLLGSVGSAIIATFALRMLPEWSAPR